MIVLHRYERHPAITSLRTQPKQVNLGLSENWRQIALLVAAIMLVGWMIGMERTILLGRNRIRRHFHNGGRLLHRCA